MVLKFTVLLVMVNLETKTTLQTNNGTNTGFTGSGGVVANKFIKNSATSTDILLGDGTTTSLDLASSSEINLTYGLVPRGACDNWKQNVTGCSGVLLTYFSSSDMLFSNGTGANTNISYSINGGMIWGACTGLNLSFLYTTPAFNGIDQYLVVGGAGATTSSYILLNGIDWPNATSISYPIISTALIYFNGLYIFGINNPSSNILTSPNGAVWTIRTSDNVPYAFCLGYDDVGVQILVASGTRISYSYNGSTWILGTGSIVSGRAVCYSSTRKEWIAHYNTLSQTYRSINGKNWVLLNDLAPYTLYNNLIWVGNTFYGIPINMYYFSYQDTFGLYTLYYSPTCSRNSWRSIRLTGATSSGGSTMYSLIYISNYDRFVLTVSATPYFRYADYSVSSGVNGGLSINGAVQLNGASNIDITSLDRPFIGLQFVHNSASISIISTSILAAIGAIPTVSPFNATGNNAARQLCSVITSPSTTSATNYTSGGYATGPSGVQVTTAYPFGLIAIFGIADTVFGADCQNFIGLWNSSFALSLLLGVQINASTQKNFIAFGSNSTDTNLCIYTAGDSTDSVVSQVDLGPIFPANRTSGAISTDWYKLALYWDGTTVYYKAQNTLYVGCVVVGSFVPAVANTPLATIPLFPQILRFHGGNAVLGAARLQIQRFGVFL